MNTKKITQAVSLLVLVFVLTTFAVAEAPAISQNASTARTIINQSQNATQPDNTSWQTTLAESMNVGQRSQNRLIYAGIAAILFMQVVILILIIRCRKKRTFILKPRRQEDV